MATTVTLDAYAIINEAYAIIQLMLSSPLSDEHTDILRQLINQTTYVCEDYTGREIVTRGSITEYQDGKGKPLLFVDHFPIISVTGLNDDTGRDFLDSTKIDTTAYVVRNDEGIIELIKETQLIGASGIFADGSLNVKITYSHGYASADVPEQLKTACVEIVAERWKYYTEHRVALNNKTAGDKAVAFTADDIPPHAKMILDKYRR